MCLQAWELLEVYRQLVASGSTETGMASTPAPIRVALGQIVRKLKQHWQMGVLLAPLLATKAAKPLGIDAAAAQQAVAAAALPSGPGVLSAVVWDLAVESQWRPLDVLCRSR